MPRSLKAATLFLESIEGYDQNLFDRLVIAVTDSTIEDVNTLIDLYISKGFSYDSLHVYL